jgi:hypothetical protein
VLGAVYWIFGIGKDALVYALAALLFNAVTFVVIFGIAGIVMGVKRLLR